MKNYTVKLDAEKGLFLLDETGKRHSVLSLLDDCGSRRVVTFDAPMGTGKTTLIKQLCEEMGTDDVVNSPTFSIVNVYDVVESKDGVSQSAEIYHFDCYRMKDIREVYDMGAEDYLYSGNWCFIEWPEILEPVLPLDTVRITIRTTVDGDRLLTID